MTLLEDFLFDSTEGINLNGKQTGILIQKTVSKYLDNVPKKYHFTNDWNENQFKD